VRSEKHPSRDESREVNLFARCVIGPFHFVKKKKKKRERERENRYSSSLVTTIAALRCTSREGAAGSESQGDNNAASLKLAREKRVMTGKGE